MNDALKPLLESELLDDETKAQIQEAWENQKQTLKEEVEVELREEFAKRYEHDKGVLVESVERMVSEALEAEIAEFVQDRKALSEQRVKLANEIRQARIDNKSKLAEQMKTIEEFTLQMLGKELKEFQLDRKEVKEKQKQLAKALRESRVAYKQKLAEHTSKVEEFILGQLKKEISEFNTDKRALVEQRVKMVAEGKKKIEETRKQFIQRSAKLVESKVSEMLLAEMTQFKEDIEASRKKAFGMQLFEAFAGEFRTSFFNENKEVRKLRQKVEEADAKLSEASKLFESAKDIAAKSQKRQKLAEGRVERLSVMNELLSKLSGKQKDVMAELLEGVKTENLREAFKKYIPAVTSGSGNTVLTRRSGKTASAVLSESKKAFTGDKESKIVESQEDETSGSGEAQIVDLKRLAGINS